MNRASTYLKFYFTIRNNPYLTAITARRPKKRRRRRAYRSQPNHPTRRRPAAPHDTSPKAPRCAKTAGELPHDHLHNKHDRVPAVAPPPRYLRGESCGARFCSAGRTEMLGAQSLGEWPWSVVAWALAPGAPHGRDHSPRHGMALLPLCKTLVWGCPVLIPDTGQRSSGETGRPRRAAIPGPLTSATIELGSSARSALRLAYPR
jgi:hypothetical protein